ncbi:MAG: energy transducer TonB [Bdellovibrionaceae bacterium]|nr:energy transducer TonB [Pseudobdellovibrionaceae bacterium]
MSISNYKILIPSLSMLFIACAPPQGFEAAKYSHEEVTTQMDIQRRTVRETTGYEVWLPKKSDPTKYQHVRYTPSGNLDTYEELAKQERSSPYHSTDFAQKIKDANITQTLKDGLRIFDIKISLLGLNDPLVFNYKIEDSKAQTNITTQATNNSKEGLQYQIISRCEDSSCKIILLTLQALKDKEVQTQASLMDTVTTFNLRTEVAAKSEQEELVEDGSNNNKNSLVAQLQSQNEAIKQSTVIIDGASRSTIRVFDPKNPETPLLNIEVPNAETFNEPIEGGIKSEVKKEDPKPETKKEDPKPETKKEDPKPETKKKDPKPETKKEDPKPETKKEDPKPETKKEGPKPETKKEDPKPETKKEGPKPETKKDIKVVLQGANPETGSLAIDVSLPKEGKEESTTARLYIGKIKKTPATQIKEHELVALYKNSVFPLVTNDLTDKHLPTTFAATARLEKYRNHSETQKYIDMWTNSKSSKIGACNSKTYFSSQRAKNFLTHMNIPVKGTGKTLGELTSNILNKVDSLPQTAYLAALEGNYWKDFDANIVVDYNPKAGYKNISHRSEYWSDASGPYGCLTDTCRQTIKNNHELLSRAGLNLQVFYVTPMEREMYKNALNNKTECVSSRGTKNIKCLGRGEIRRTIFNTGKENDYKNERIKASLASGDARKYFASATLLAGLEIRRMLYEKKPIKSKEVESSSKKQKYEWELRDDPALAIFSYRSGEGNMAKSSICSQLPTKEEREKCLSSTTIRKAVSKRHEGFHVTFDEIADLKMTNCDYIDYIWAWLALQFIGSNPLAYDIEVGTPNIAPLTVQSLMPSGLSLSNFTDPLDNKNGKL